MNKRVKSLIFILIFAFPTLTNSISILPTNGISGYRNQDFQVTSPPQNYSDTPTRQSNFLKSSVERIANAKWNEMDDESIELLQNNATINWPTPETDFMPYQSNDIKSTLNSSQTIKQMGTMYERSEGSDTTVFQDDCTSVIGWIPQSSWDGEQLVDQIQTGIPLIISNTMDDFSKLAAMVLERLPENKVDPGAVEILSEPVSNNKPIYQAWIVLLVITGVLVFRLF